MGTQLLLPLRRPIPEPVHKAAEAAQEASVRVATPSEPKDEFERLHDELEGLYLRLVREMLYGPPFVKAWAKARADTCKSYGWTEEAFYAELRKRMDARRAGST